MNSSRRGNRFPELELCFLQDDKANRALSRMLETLRRDGTGTMTTIWTEYDLMTREECEETASKRPWNFEFVKLD